MEQDLFSDLPSETILDILSRLPVATIMRCKCACKSWLELLQTREFVNCHLSRSRSPPCLTFFEKGARPKPFKIKEYKIKEFDLEYLEHRWNTVFNFDLPDHDVMCDTVDGLILIRGGIQGDFFICNPITRDCIKLQSGPRTHEYRYRASGFGVSQMSCQYKVVRIFAIKVGVLECYVYTVGTGSWRRIRCRCPVINEVGVLNKGGIFLNGNLHWLAITGSSISCLELETETFTTFSTPPLIIYPYKFRSIIVLKDSLCLCDNSDYRYGRSEVYANYADYEIVIWMMKEYRDEKSWTKEFIIRKDYRLQYLGLMVPIKVFEDGGVLMEWTGCGRSQWLYYSSKTSTIRELETFRFKNCRLAATYSPSFLPLKNFGSSENVCSF